jgi:hypothetical protein
VSDRHVLPLTRYDRPKAIQGIDAAIAKGGWLMELRASTRSDEQNRAIHGLIGQIMKQRSHHNGVRMDKALWKAVFLQALGEEVRFVPTLDGDGLFPLGLSTSKLTVARGSELIEFIMAWCAREGLTVEHFGEFTPEAKDGEAAKNPSPMAA